MMNFQDCLTELMETIEFYGLTDKKIKRLIDNLYFITKNYSIEYIEFDVHDFGDPRDVTPESEEIICHIKVRGYLRCYFILDQDLFWIIQSIIRNKCDEYSSSHSFYYEE